MIASWILLGLALGVLYTGLSRWMSGSKKPEVVATMALRRQTGEAYMDIQFSVTQEEIDSGSVEGKIKGMFDISGSGAEKIIQEMDAANEAKRDAGKGKSGKIRSVG
jgi:hypothetical protein